MTYLVYIKINFNKFSHSNIVARANYIKKFKMQINQKECLLQHLDEASTPATTQAATLFHWATLEIRRAVAYIKFFFILEVLLLQKRSYGYMITVTFNLSEEMINTLCNAFKLLFPLRTICSWFTITKYMLLWFFLKSYNFAQGTICNAMGKYINIM